MSTATAPVSPAEALIKVAGRPHHWPPVSPLVHTIINVLGVDQPHMTVAEIQTALRLRHNWHTSTAALKNALDRIPGVLAAHTGSDAYTYHIIRQDIKAERDVPNTLSRLYGYQIMTRIA